MSTQTAPAEIASERHGSRWLYAHPSEQDARDWFATQRLHPGMEHDPYMGGIVIIPAKEKVNVTVEGPNGSFVREVERAVFTPYVKVDTRIAYFWDLVRYMNDGWFGDYVGRIQPVEQRLIENEASPYFNANLPKGYTIYPVRQNEQNVSRYLVATFEVTITHRESGVVVLKGTGSKQTAMKRQYPDDNAVMKAETGAVGRALGMAGILVVGTGVATAEDIQDDMRDRASGGSTASPSAAQLPADDAGAAVTGEPQLAGSNVAEAPLTAESMGAAIPDNDADLRTLAGELRATMQAKHPEVWSAYTAWWAERFPDQQLKDVSGPALRGAVIKLQRDLDAAEQG